MWFSAGKTYRHALWLNGSGDAASGGQNPAEWASGGWEVGVWRRGGPNGSGDAASDGQNPAQWASGGEQKCQKANTKEQHEPA